MSSRPQRPMTALPGGYKSGMNNSKKIMENQNSQRPQTFHPDQNPQQEQQQQKKKNYYLGQGMMHHKSASLSAKIEQFKSQQYSQHIGDEGERLDEEQIKKQNLISDINKKRPRQQRIDKEKMYEEAINLNNNLARLQKEQKNLEIKLLEVEEDKAKNQKLIQDVEAFIKDQKGPKINGHMSQLVFSLKKQLQKLEDKLADSDKEIGLMQKHQIYTKQQEYEIFLFHYKEESESFRNQLKETKKQNRKIFLEIEKERKKKNPNYEMKRPDKVKITDADILQLEVYDQRAKLQILQQQNDLLLSKKQTEERKVQQNLLSLNQLRDKLQRKDNFCSSMETDKQQLIENEKKKKQKQKDMEQKLLKKKTMNTESSFMMPKKLEPTSSDIKQLQIQEKQYIVEQQAQKIIEIDNYLTEKVQKETEQRNQMTNKVTYLRNVISNLEEKLDKIDNVLEDELSHLPIEHIPKFGKGQYTEVFQVQNDILHSQSEVQLKQVPKVITDDIQVIVKELEYRLRIKQISLFKALQRITPDKVQLRGVGSVQTMQSILMKSPFSILDSEEALLVARYLVEDNQSDYVDLDMKRTQSQEVIRCVFKKLLGNYELYTEEEEYQLWEDLSHIITKYGVGLQQQALLYDKYEETGILCPRDIEHCFANVIEIPQHKLDYILLRLFEHGNTYKQMEFNQVNEIFKQGKWLDRQQRKRVSKVLQEDVAQNQKRYKPLHNLQVDDDEINSNINNNDNNVNFSQQSSGSQVKQQHQNQNLSPLETNQDRYFSKSPTRQSKISRQYSSKNLNLSNFQANK